MTYRQKAIQGKLRKQARGLKRFLKGDVEYFLGEAARDIGHDFEFTPKECKAARKVIFDEMIKILKAEKKKLR